MALTLYTYMPNYRAYKALIAAEYNDVKINVPDFQLHRDNVTPEFLAKNPLGKVPVLDTPQGAIFESNAIARYVARLRQDSDLYGTCFHESALVDQWVDFSTNELEPLRAVWLYPIFGFLKFDREAYEATKRDIVKVLNVLERHLETRTYIVGHKISLADIVLAASLVDLYRLVFSPEFRAPFVNLNRWFSTLVNQPQFIKVLGKVDFASEEKQAADAGAAAAPAGGKNNKKDEKKKDNKPAEAKKDEKKKDNKPAEKPAAAAAADDGEDAPAEKKEKNPLDSLPASTMVLDAVKKSYFARRNEDNKSNEDNFNAWFAEFWKNFDNNGYCIYRSDYQYDAENRVYFMTSNLMNGWVQRLDELRKYGFGTVVMLGKDDDTPPFAVKGAWIFRGTDVPKEMRECPDTEYHTLTRLDATKEADRKVFESFFSPHSKAVDGTPVLQRVMYC